MIQPKTAHARNSFIETASMRKSTITRTASARIPTKYGEFQLHHYKENVNGIEHLALTLGTVQDQEDLLVRVHSECFTGDLLGSLRCDCGEQLQKAMQSIAREGRGLLIYLRQEGRGIGLSEKLRAYNLQDQGYDTVEANLLLGHVADARTYDAAAAILADLGVRSLRLLTNNPAKIDCLQALGVVIKERVPILPHFQMENVAYLKAKVERMQHMLTLPPESNGSAASVVEATPSKMSSAVVVQLNKLQQRIERHNQTRPHTDRQTRRPFVTLSHAQSLDGSIAAIPGQHLSLSSPQSYTVTHALRAQHQTILVGIGTVLADNPRLNVRLVDGPNPQPIVVDTNLRTPINAALFAEHKSVLVATASLDPERRMALETVGASTIHAPTTPRDRVDLGDLLDELGQLGVKSVMVEGGATIINSFLDQGLVDYVMLTIAPTFVGGLHSLSPRYQKDAQQKKTTAQMAPLPPLLNPIYTQVGPDMLIWGALKEEHA